MPFLVMPEKPSIKDYQIEEIVSRYGSGICVVIAGPAPCNCDRDLSDSFAKCMGWCASRFQTIDTPVGPKKIPAR